MLNKFCWLPGGVALLRHPGECLVCSRYSNCGELSCELRQGRGLEPFPQTPAGTGSPAWPPVTQQPTGSRSQPGRGLESLDLSPGSSLPFKAGPLTPLGPRFPRNRYSFPYLLLLFLGSHNLSPRRIYSPGSEGGHMAQACPSCTFVIGSEIGTY